jgi:hypothetical protein
MNWNTSPSGASSTKTSVAVVEVEIVALSSDGSAVEEDVELAKKASANEFEPVEVVDDDDDDDDCKDTAVSDVYHFFTGAAEADAKMTNSAKVLILTLLRERSL